MDVCAKTGVFLLRLCVFGFVCAMDGERATTGRPYYHVMTKTLRGQIFTRYNALIRGVFFLFVNGIMIIYF